MFLSSYFHLVPQSIKPSESRNHDWQHFSRNKPTGTVELRFSHGLPNFRVVPRKQLSRLVRYTSRRRNMILLTLLRPFISIISVPFSSPLRLNYLRITRFAPSQAIFDSTLRSIARPLVIVWSFSIASQNFDVSWITIPSLHHVYFLSELL